MRETKFRAWNPIEQKLEYWTLNDLCYHGPDRPDICLQKWQQYTGLKDKNGKEIYEGDIIAFKQRNVYNFIERKGYAPAEGIWIEQEEGENVTPSFTEKVIYARKCYVVKWQDDLTGFFPFADSPENCGHCGGGYSPGLFEVVGNIYENPELLK